ncbi:MAG TPA: heme-binding protein [Burkholderiaceae bacterium]|nr:heme-binding protein [Burkholderiaceae bacterium]
MRKIKLHAAAALLAAAAAAATGAEPATYSVKLLTPEAATKAARAALEDCRKRGYQVTVAVVDRSGVAQAVMRDRFAGPHTVQTAINKGYSAVSFRTDTLELAAATQAGSASSGIRQIPNVVAVGGGVNIAAGGATFGAIGVSGAPTGVLDDACAKAGIAAIRDELEF